MSGNKAKIGAFTTSAPQQKMKGEARASDCGAGSKAVSAGTKTPHTGRKTSTQQAITEEPRKEKKKKTRENKEEDMEEDQD